MQPTSGQNNTSYQFDAFEVDPVRRLLLRDGKTIALKPKVFETLLVLVRNSGRVMDKDELMQQVWPDTVVEDVNLAHNISLLRKALGQRADENRFIITVPGRGYGFVAEVKENHRDAPSPGPAVSDAHLADTGLPPVEEAKHKIARALGRKGLVFVGALAGVAMVIALGMVINSSRKRAPQPFAQIKSIAVLPFKPLVAESRDESLEMGMADTLIARSSNIRDISVRPISAVRKYAGVEQDAVSAGREQKVDAVIDGQIQKSGEKIRVTVRMVSVEGGVSIWTHQFDDDIKDLFRVQDSISERVASVLALKLTGEEKERLTKSYTNNTEAYRLYLLGRYHVNITYRRGPSEESRLLSTSSRERSKLCSRACRPCGLLQRTGRLQCPPAQGCLPKGEIGCPECRESGSLTRPGSHGVSDREFYF
jgi:serine/threonine-protein kinase